MPAPVCTTCLLGSHEEAGALGLGRVLADVESEAPPAAAAPSRGALLPPHKTLEEATAAAGDEAGALQEGMQG